MIKKFFRERYSTLLLIVGLTLSFFVAVNTLSSLNKLEKEQNNKNRHSYDIEYDMLFGTTDEGDEEGYEYADKLESLIDTLQCKSGNLFLYGYFNFVGDGFGNPVTYVALSINEKFCEKFIWGGLPDKESIENKENTVIVSENLKEYVYDLGSEKYIDIESSPVKVTGMYESYFEENSTKDMDICIFYDCLDENMKNSIKEQADFALKISYGSSELSEREFQENFNTFKTCIENGNYEMVKMDNRKKPSAKNNLLYAKLRLNMIFMYVVLGFTLINCMMISDIWVKRRYNEFVIRRTYGYSLCDMVVLLIKDLSGYIGCAMAAAVVLQTLYAMAFGETHIELTCIRTNVTYLLCMVAVILCVNLIVPVCQIRRILPAQSIRKQKK
ncbi:MAG: hypothetical protein K2M60_00800 [Lachnospiraceae bacterium]|nr:hypothetical protein [Lachnospiraceae bacterium]MDE6251658.1 hypothetical protein [Lachnospiraceae bacterium]